MVRLLALLTPLLVGIFFSVGEHPSEPKFFLKEMLFVPHQTKAMVRVIPQTTATMRVRYGTARNAMTSFAPSSSGTSVTADTPGEFTLTTGLAADTTYYYQLEILEDGDWKGRGVHEHRTLPSATTAVYDFAITADTHFWPPFSSSMLGLDCSTRQDFAYQHTWKYAHGRFALSAMRDVAGLDPLFHLDLGDGLIGCQSGMANDCPTLWPDGGTGDGSTGSTATSETEERQFCERRLRSSLEWITFHKADVPVVLIEGNHDGHPRYGSLSGGTVGHYNGGSTGQAKRMFYTSWDATEKYTGNANQSGWYPNTGCTPSCTEQEGHYYAFQAGSALFIKLTPFEHTPPGWGGDLDGDTVSAEDPDDFFPRTADQWSYGDEQLSWLLNLLDTTSAKWVFLVEHSFPGAPSPENAHGNYHYSKFGLGVERYCVDEPGTLCECHAGEQCGGTPWTPHQCSTGLCEDPDPTAPWRGPAQAVLVAAKAAAVGNGGAVFVLLGHDHFTFSAQYQDSSGAQPVFFITHSSTSIDQSSTNDPEGCYKSQHIAPLFGSPPALPMAADPIWGEPVSKAGLGHYARGWFKWTVNGETNVTMRFYGLRVLSSDHAQYAHPYRFHGKQLMCINYTNAGQAVCP